jgi:UDP-glucose/GDP-mannose dehydrogenase family, central domain
LLNELATFGDSVDIDSWGAIDAVSSKSFGYVRFTPGPGVGGHFLPIDPSHLGGWSSAGWGRRSRSSSWPTMSTSECQYVVTGRWLFATAASGRSRAARC